MNERWLALVCVIASMSGLGCTRGEASAAAPSASAAAQASAPKASPARLVFVDREDACDCTKARTDTSWSALQAVLGEDSDLPVERLHSDTQEAAVAPYRTQQAFVALPALYVVDDAGKVIAMLQGELSREAIAGAIGAR